MTETNGLTALTMLGFGRFWIVFVALVMADEVGGRHAIMVLEALREVARRGKATGVGYFGDILVGGGEKLSGALHTLYAENLHRGVASNLLAAAVHLCAAKADGVAEVFDRELGIADVAIDELHEAGEETQILFAVLVLIDGEGSR